MKTKLISTFSIVCFLFSSAFCEKKITSLPKYYDTLPSNIENLVVIHDPLNWIFRVLDNPAVRDLFNEKHYPKSFTKNSSPPDVEKWIKTIEQQSTWIPEQTVLGFDPTYIKNVDTIVKSFLYGMHYKAGIELKLSKDSKEMSELSKHLLKNIKKFQIPELHLWTRFRSPMSSNLAFSMAQFSISAVKGNLPYPLPIEMTADEISLEVQLSNYLPSLILKSAINNMQLGDLSEKDIQEIIEFIQNLSFKVSLLKNESTLWFKISPLGNQTKKEALATSPFPDMGRSESAFDILSTKWNIENLVQYVVEWQQIIQTHKATELGHKVIELDPEAILDSFNNLTDKIEPIGTKAKIHYWHDVTTHWLGEIEGFRKAPTLNEYKWPISSLSGLHSWIIDTSVDFSKQAQITLSDLNAQIKSKQNNLNPNSQMNVDKFMYFYQEHLSQFLSSLIKDSADIFDQGYYFGLHRSEKVSHIKAKEKNEEHEWKDQNIPSIIFLAKVKDEKAAPQFISKTFRELEKNLWKYHLEKDHGPALFEKSTLANVSTTKFRLDRFISMISNGEANLNIKGDFGYHFYIHNQHFVISSSKSLSNDFLTNHMSKGSIKLNKSVITKANINPTQFGDYLDLIHNISKKTSEEDLTDVFNWLHKVLALIENIDLQVEQDKTGYVRSVEGQIKYPD